MIHVLTPVTLIPDWSDDAGANSGAINSNSEDVDEHNGRVGAVGKAHVARKRGDVSSKDQATIGPT